MTSEKKSILKPDNTYEKKESAVNLNNIPNVKKKIKVSSKKIKKQENALEKVKLDVTYTEKEKNLSIDKSSFINQHRNNSQSSKNDYFSSTMEKSNSPKTNTNKTFAKDSILSKDFEKQETLDMLESSWGEKFIKVIKNNINKGIYKVDFSIV